MIAAGVVFLIAAIAIFFVYNKPHRTADKADESVDAGTLLTAFDKSEEEANKRFLDKVIEVKGKVREVIEQEDSYVLMLGEEGSFNGISCTLDQEQDSVAFGLKAGDEVVVRGICTGFLLDVVLINCKVISD